MSQQIYNALFPYYVEVCTVTQYVRRLAKPGGWGGHASLFLHGAELAPAGHPRLRLVPERSDLSAPDSGTGVSVNRIFTSASWVAVPGRDEFFHGAVTGDQLLDEPAYEAAVERAAASGWFAGIAIEDAVMRRKPPGMRADEFIVRNSIGTDFAITFARTAYSARLPLTRDAMGKVIAYLNRVNEAALRTGARWDLYTNNCSHVVHNALAATGVWDPKEARKPGTVSFLRTLLSVSKAVAARRLSDFAFPANTFVRTYEAGNERPIDDAVGAFSDHDLVRTIQDGWLGTGPGAVIARYPMHDAGRNALFAAGRDPFLFSVPLFWDKKHRFMRLTRNPPASTTDLGANLAQFRDRYARTLATRRDEAVPFGLVDQNAFGRFRDRFYAQIAEELRRTEERIAEYRRLVPQSLSAEGFRSTDA